ncbi:MAG: TlpA family protein disulfide reductase [Christensenellales bacterium]
MRKTARSIAFIVMMLMIFLLLGCSANVAEPSPTPEPTKSVTETPAPDAEQDVEEEKEYAFTRSDFPAFETTDIDGNAISNSVFSEAKLTMVNLWGTWCGPCVGELPELQKISQDYAQKGVKVIGVYDYSSMDEEVRALMEANGLTYTMAHYADAFYELETGYVPTTYFVDGQGRIMSSAFVGAKDYDGWSTVIDALLKDVD